MKPRLKGMKDSIALVKSTHSKHEEMITHFGDLTERIASSMRSVTITTYRGLIGASSSLSKELCCSGSNTS